MAGAYQIVFDGINMGRTEVGFEMIVRPSFNVIRADETGRTPVEALFTGIEDIVIRVDGIEWSNNIWAKALHFITWDAVTGAGSTSAPDEGVVVPSGSLVSREVGSLVLTPLTAKALSGNDGGIYTFAAAYPLEPVRTVFSSQRLRSASMGFFVFATSVASSVPVMYTAAYA